MKLLLHYDMWIQTLKALATSSNVPKVYRNSVQFENNPHLDYNFVQTSPQNQTKEDNSHLTII